MTRSTSMVSRASPGHDNDDDDHGDDDDGGDDKTRQPQATRQLNSQSTIQTF